MILTFDYLECQIDLLDKISPKTKVLVIKKGRRWGLTHMMAIYFIEQIIESKKLLWGDTIHANIDRYVERYFFPTLKKNNLSYNWNAQRKVLQIEGFEGYVDFRSADKPENWEGFGYDIIFLNEAGIILKNKYLYTNAVLPMLLDSPKSMLIAGGVPKGKTLRNGDEHPFYSLAKQTDDKRQVFTFTSYDNPLLKADDIQEIEKQIARMNPEMVRQEIYGEFVDGAAGMLWTTSDIKRIKTLPTLDRIVLAIDPAISANAQSDETGIVVCGKEHNGNYYVIADLSGRYSPNQWATVAAQAIDTYKVDCIAAEGNQGGDMVESVLRGKIGNTRIKLVKATKGKFVRAEPIYDLYEQGKVYHLGELPQLEQQMYLFTGDTTKGSPDRVDALVWALTELSTNANDGDYYIY